MLGKLTAYFSQVDEPVILVFWGDHYNPIDSNYDVYTTTGYASDSSADPRLHQTTLLMWSNYSDAQVDLGTCRLRHLAGDDEPLRPAAAAVLPVPEPAAPGGQPRLHPRRDHEPGRHTTLEPPSSAALDPGALDAAI